MCIGFGSCHEGIVAASFAQAWLSALTDGSTLAFATHAIGVGGLFGDLTAEQAKSYPGKNFITRAIGTEPTVMCDIGHYNVETGDYLLLCSDGLSNMMDDQEILFEAVHGVDKRKCCKRLLDIAKNRGAPDNVTTVLILV